MDTNPFAPPTATVADVPVVDGAPTGPRRMPLGVRLLQLFCSGSLYFVLRNAWVAANYLLTQDAPLGGVWFVLAWQLAVAAFTVAVAITLQRRAKSARAWAQGYCGYMMCTIAFVALTEPKGEGTITTALMFAALLGWLWYGSCWSKKARAFFAS